MMNLSVLLLILATVFCFADAGSETTTYGKMGSDDQLLEKRRVQKSFVVTGGVISNDQFPQGVKIYNAKITCIKIIDKINNGADRYAKIITGGVGQRFVEIQFYATIYRGFDYEVEIYGKKQ